MARSKLAKFRNPPVVEAVCGIYFHELAEIHSPHLGAFWAKIRRDFPGLDTQPTLPSMSLAIQPPFTFLAGKPDLPRTWFISADETVLLQVQRDRLMLNWRRGSAVDVLYPSFAVLINKLKKVISLFESFINEQEVGSLTIMGLELDYVNAISLDRELKSTSDVTRIFPLLDSINSKSHDLDAMSALNLNAQFRLPSEGHLGLNLQSSQRQTDGQPILRLDISARWLATDIKRDSIWKWFEEAHETAVTTFAQITSKEAQESWERLK